MKLMPMMGLKPMNNRLMVRLGLAWDALFKKRLLFVEFRDDESMSYTGVNTPPNLGQQMINLANNVNDILYHQGRMQATVDEAYAIIDADEDPIPDGEEE